MSRYRKSQFRKIWEAVRDRPDLARSLRQATSDIAWAIVALLYLFGYYAWSDPYDRADMDYVFSGAVVCVLFTYAAVKNPSEFVTIGFVIGAFEGFQKAACGTTWGGPSAEDICVAQYGHMPYFAVALISSLYIGARRWDWRKWLNRVKWSRLARSFLQRLNSLISGR